MIWLPARQDPSVVKWWKKWSWNRKSRCPTNKDCISEKIREKIMDEIESGTKFCRCSWASGESELRMSDLPVKRDRLYLHSAWRYQNMKNEKGAAAKRQLLLFLSECLCFRNENISIVTIIYHWINILSIQKLEFLKWKNKTKICAFLRQNNNWQFGCLVIL